MRTRLAFALALGGCVGAASYAVQHLYAVLGAPADFALPTAAAHIPFYWRAALMGLHAVLAGTLVFLGFSEEQALRWLGRIPLLVVLVVLPLAALMVAVP